MTSSPDGNPTKWFSELTFYRSRSGFASRFCPFVASKSQVRIHGIRLLQQRRHRSALQRLWKLPRPVLVCYSVKECRAALHVHFPSWACLDPEHATTPSTHRLEGNIGGLDCPHLVATSPMSHPDQLLPNPDTMRFQPADNPKQSAAVEKGSYASGELSEGGTRDWGRRRHHLSIFLLHSCTVVYGRIGDVEHDVAIIALVTAVKGAYMHTASSSSTVN